MKKLLSLLLSIAIILATTPFSVFTVSAYTSEGYNDSGICGANVTWRYIESNATLIISGTGAMYNYNDYYGENAYYSRTFAEDIKHLIIEEGVTAIGKYGFVNLLFLKDVSIPKSMKSIGSYAFEDSLNLKTIYNYSNLNFVIGDIGYGGIAKYATSVIKCYRGSGVCGTNAEYSFDSRYITLYINGYGPMYDDRSYGSMMKSYGIKYIDIKNGITHIGSSAFADCTFAHWPTIPKSVTSIGAKAFKNFGMLSKSLELPDSITTIGAEAFSESTTLKSIVLPENLTKIEDGVFSGCAGLEEIVIPDSVEEIGENAFKNCNNLNSITLPKNLKKIGVDAFSGCTSLKEVNISSVENWCNIDFENQYSNPLYYAKEISVNGNNLKSLVIPENVYSIKPYTFIGCNGLTDVEFHSGITNIGTYAFAECSNILEVTLPNSLTAIGENAFDKTVVIFGYSDSVSEEYANQNGNAFYSRNNIVNDLISWEYNRGTLYIKGMDKTPNYNLFTSTPWYKIKDHIKSIEIDERITSVGTYSFYGFENLIAIATDNKNLTFGQYSVNTNLPLTFYSYSGGSLETYCSSNNFNFEKHLSKPNVTEITPDTITVEQNAGWLYSLDKINWTDSNVFENLNECTTYTVYIRRVEGLTPMATRPSEGAVAITPPYPTPDKPVLFSVTADAIEVVKVDGIEYSLDREVWNSTGKFEGLSPLTSYRIYARPITDIVAAQKISEALAVTTPDYPTPEVPTLNKVTSSTIEINVISGLEYSLDKINWTTTGRFTDLLPAQSYNVYARPVTDIIEAQKVSKVLTVTTLKTTVPAPSAPVIESYGNGKIVIKATDGYEYSIDGINWQSSSVFENLAYDTLYYLYQRVAETGTEYVSSSSDFTKIIVPSVPIISFIGATSISVEVKDGYEYSLDKIYWQTTGEFDMLITGLEYTVYCRAIYQNALYQAISEGVTVIPEDVPPYAFGDINGDENVDILDLINLKNILLGDSHNNGASPDINNDGLTNSEDLVFFKKYLFENF